MRSTALQSACRVLNICSQIELDRKTEKEKIKTEIRTNRKKHQIFIDIFAWLRESFYMCEAVYAQQKSTVRAHAHHAERHVI